MGLKSDLQQLNSDLNSGLDKLDADLTRLEEKIANTPAQEDVSEELASLRATVSRLQSLDRPDPESAPAESTGGVIVDSGTLNPPVDENTAASPGEPDVEPESPGEPENPPSESPGDVSTDQPVEETPAPQGDSEGNTESV